VEHSEIEQRKGHRGRTKERGSNGRGPLEDPETLGREKGRKN
jgi:hypothetical protein